MKSLIGLVVGATLAMAALGGEVVSAGRLEARKEFADLKFGIFLHWGIYSTFAQGEWYLERGGLRENEYAKAANAFYPHSFDAREWVKAFKAAGAKYVVFTTRHHDGFSMFNTKATDYDIVDATPFKRDVVKELAETCREEGLKLGLYYSLMDCPPLDWRFDELYAHIHRLQPKCLVLNNHHHAMRDGEDIQGFERDAPGENKAGYSAGQKVEHEFPLETCDTMSNGAWGYQVGVTEYKSAGELRDLLRSTNKKGANLLLNIGPQPDGSLPAQALDQLERMVR